MGSWQQRRRRLTPSSILNLSPKSKINYDFACGLFAREKLEIILLNIFKQQTPPEKKKPKKIITGRSVMAARMLWEHLARVRISAARQKNKRMSRV